MLDSLGNVIPEDALIIRHTEIGSLRNCKRRWFFESHNGMNLEPLFEDPKRIFGTAWHSALESLYLHYASTGKYSISKAVDAFREKLDSSWDKLCNAVLSFGDEESTMDLDVYKSMLNMGEVLLPMYGDWANSSECKPPDRELKVISAEQRLIVPLLSPRVYITAKIDTVVQHTTHDKMTYIMEHKTSSSSSSVTNPGVLDIDLQLAIQLWVIRQVYPDLNVAGILYNAMRKQLPSNRVKAPIFGRTIVYKSTKELDRTMQMIALTDVMDMVLCKNNKMNITYNPQVLGVCSWGCKFYNACSAINRGEDIDSIIESSFKTRDKNIWQMLEEEVD
jgi:hypothetical protein